MKKIASVNVLILFIVLALALAGMTSFAQQKLEKAPLNPAFLEYQGNGRAEGRQKLALGEFGLGLIPSPVDLSRLRASEIVDDSFMSPSSYDLRNYGKVTAVRNQEDCGSCWAFASMASVESCLLTAETRDFSENNLKNKHGFDNSCCDGGNLLMSSAYFARWSGPGNESDDYYDPGSCYSPSFITNQKQVQDIIFIPGRSNALDNDAIKQAVMNYGAVAISMYWDDYSYESSNAAFYYDGGSDTNHAVAIIGWDDNYSSAYFNYAPPGNGAFLVRNSWGGGWGSSGYFWISYYDTATAYGINAVFTRSSASTYSAIYQYDTLGWTLDLGYGSTDTAWYANMFTASGSHSLSAVSTYFLTNNCSYELYIYKGCSAGSPRSGSLAYSKTGSMTNAGYHTITVDQPVSLSSGQLFSIVIKMRTPGYGYPIPVEYPISGYSSYASASSYQSFCSGDGSSWSDLTSDFSNTNVCIKGFAGAGGSCPTITVSPSTLPSGSVGAGYSQAFTASGGASPYSYAVTSGNLPAGLYLSSNGTVSGTPTAQGTYNFTVTATDAGSCTGSRGYTVSISSVNPPVVTSMVKKGNPFRVLVYGSNFQNYIAVYIDGYQWSTGYIVGTTKIVLKGGSSLKARVPKYTPTTFRFVNQDGGETTVVWQWP